MLGAWLGLLGAARTDRLPVDLDMINEMINSLGTMADSNMIKSKMVNHLGTSVKMGFNDIAASQAKAEQIVVFLKFLVTNYAKACAEVQKKKDTMKAFFGLQKNMSSRINVNALMDINAFGMKYFLSLFLGEFFNTEAENYKDKLEAKMPKYTGLLMKVELLMHLVNKFLATSHTNETKYDGLLEKAGNKVMNLDLNKQIIEVDCDADRRYYSATEETSGSRYARRGQVPRHGLRQ